MQVSHTHQKGQPSISSSLLRSIEELFQKPANICHIYLKPVEETGFHFVAHSSLPHPARQAPLRLGPYTIVLREQMLVRADTMVMALPIGVPGDTRKVLLSTESSCSTGGRPDEEPCSWGAR